MLTYSLILLFVGLLGVLVWKGFAPDRTFSQKVATSWTSTIFYIALFAVATPMLYVFFTYDFIPRLQLGQVFYVIMIVSMVGQILCTLFPERGNTVVAHRVFTAISGVLLLPLLAMIGLSPVVTQSVRWLIVVCIALMLALLVIALMNQKGYRHALWLQIGYYVLFFVPIVVLS